MSELIEDDCVAQASQGKLTESLAPNSKSVDAVRRAVVAVLRFAHYSTAGHAYACLKIAEYCVTRHAEKCFSNQADIELGLALGSQEFLDALGTRIFSRCFPRYNSDSSVQELKDMFLSDVFKMAFKLREHGLWH